MKSIGATLRDTREQLGLSLEQVIHETNISRHYIEALEAERFEEFNAETYLIGFLRNYAQFLGLDSNRFVEWYKNYKLNEEPMPIKELIGPPKGYWAKKVFLIILTLAVIGGLGVIGIPKLIDLFNSIIEERQSNIIAPPPPREIRPDQILWEGVVRPGDTLILEDPKGNIPVFISSNLDRLELNANDVGRWRLLPGEEIYIPGSNNRPKWRIGMKEYESSGSAILEIQELPNQTIDELNFLEDINMDPPSGIEDRRRSMQTIVEANSPYPFQLNISVENFCLMRYKADNQDVIEKYYSSGDDIQLNVGDIIYIWASNSGALIINVNEREISLGRNGEVFSGHINWVNLDNQKYALMMIPMY